MGDGLREQLLARARLALDEHRHVPKRDPARALNEARHHFAAVDVVLKLRRRWRLCRALVSQALVGLAQQVREKLGCDVERNRDRLHALLA